MLKGDGKTDKMFQTNMTLSKSKAQAREIDNNTALDRVNEPSLDLEGERSLSNETKRNIDLMQA